MTYIGLQTLVSICLSVFFTLIYIDSVNSKETLTETNACVCDLWRSSNMLSTLFLKCMFECCSCLTEFILSKAELCSFH